MDRWLSSADEPPDDVAQNLPPEDEVVEDDAVVKDPESVGHGMLQGQDDPARFQPPSEEELKRRCTVFQLDTKIDHDPAMPASCPSSIAELESPATDTASDNRALWSNRVRQEMHDKIASWNRICEKAYQDLP